MNLSENTDFYASSWVETELGVYSEIERYSIDEKNVCLRFKLWQGDNRL